LRTPTAQDLAAVEAAEQFVAAYGYTDSAPSIPSDRLAREIWDGLMSEQELIAYRHNYLEPRAVGFIRHKRQRLVVFKVTDQALATGKDLFPFSPIGRHVIVGPDLTAGIMHSWADLSDPTMIRLR
jgi:hypothetical protein